MSRDITYGSYVETIQTKLKKYGYSSSEISAFMNKADIKKYVTEEYNEYVSENPSDKTSGGHNPDAVAYCLDMLY